MEKTEPIKICYKGHLTLNVICSLEVEFLVSLSFLITLLDFLHCLAELICVYLCSDSSDISDQNSNFFILQ